MDLLEALGFLTESINIKRALIVCSSSHECNEIKRALIDREFPCPDKYTVIGQRNIALLQYIECGLCYNVVVITRNCDLIAVLEHTTNKPFVDNDRHVFFI